MTTLPEGPFFEFLLFTNNAPQTLPARISAADIGKLKEIPHQINSVLRTFGRRASDVYNLGDRLRIYLLPESDPELPHVADDSYFSATMQRTAKEIVENSLKPVPAPLAKAVTSQGSEPAASSIATTADGQRGPPSVVRLNQRQQRVPPAPPGPSPPGRSPCVSA